MFTPFATTKSASSRPRCRAAWPATAGSATSTCPTFGSSSGPSSSGSRSRRSADCFRPAPTRGAHGGQRCAHRPRAARGLRGRPAGAPVRAHGRSGADGRERHRRAGAPQPGDPGREHRASGDVRHRGGPSHRRADHRGRRRKPKPPTPTQPSKDAHAACSPPTSPSNIPGRAGGFVGKPPSLNSGLPGQTGRLILFIFLIEGRVFFSTDRNPHCRLHAGPYVPRPLPSRRIRMPLRLYGGGTRCRESPCGGSPPTFTQSVVRSAVRNRRTGSRGTGAQPFL